MSISFLITGTSRSGTTLVDKLLDSHPSTRALSQPIPKVYRAFKSEFFNSLGVSDVTYVLNDLFDERRYTAKDFLSFLMRFRMSHSEMATTLDSMQGWSGQYTKLNKDALLENYRPQTLIEFYSHMLEVYQSQSGIQAIGTKETLVEEFVEYYLQSGVKIILVVRDPRDVITSLNIGKGTEYGGTHRPTLFHIRNWRKSIAVANTFNDHKGFMMLKYEDLIDHQTKTLQRITDFLSIDPFKPNHFENGIKRSDGGYWEGNSSSDKHTGINSKNKGKYRKHLDPNTISYIEYLCAPELKMLDYEFDFELKEPESFKEPFEIGECQLDPKMSGSSFELDKERLRLSLLKESTIPLNETLAQFYSERNFQQLKEQFN